MDSWDKFYQMGLPNEKSDFKLDSGFSKTEWKNTIIPPVEIPADSEELNFTSEGIFYKGQRVILYIRDQVHYLGYETEYKFHITCCVTLKSMIKQNRYNKYVVTNDTNGIFKVNFIIDNKPVEKEIKLNVCKHCLKNLNWKGYKKSYGNAAKLIYKNFSLEEFFKTVNEDNQKNFLILPEHTAESAPLNVYPETWAKISKLLRTENGYICSDCHKKITDTKNLHVHHRNGIKNDCSRSNLEVLCAECHQKRHNHKFFGGKNF